MFQFVLIVSSLAIEKSLILSSLHLPFRHYKPACIDINAELTMKMYKSNKKSEVSGM